METAENSNWIKKINWMIKFSFQFKKLCKEQGEEIEKLKRTMAAKDQRIFKLEMELTSKDAEIAEAKEQLSKKVAELKEANRRLEANRADVSSVDGRTPQAGEVTVTKTTSQVRVQSMPGARPMPVEEAITPSQRTKNSLDDYDIQQALEETNVGLGRGADVSRETVRIVESQPSRTATQYREEPGATNVMDDYRIEDIDAELESLREDLARTRDQRQTSKTTVRHVSEGMGRDDGTPRVGGYSRTVYTDSTSTTEVTTPRQDPYGNYGGVGSPPKYSYQGGQSPPKSGNSAVSTGVRSGTTGGEGTRMVITTASYARVPSVERQNKDRKVSLLIECFNKGVVPNTRHRRSSSGEILRQVSNLRGRPTHNPHKRSASGDTLLEGRGIRTARSRRDRPKSASNVADWEKFMKENNIKDN